MIIQHRNLPVTITEIRGRVGGTEKGVTLSVVNSWLCFVCGLRIVRNGAQQSFSSSEFNREENGHHVHLSSISPSNNCFEGFDRHKSCALLRTLLLEFILFCIGL